ncbi:GPI-anchored beta-1,3-endoglucanase EglC [Aspergillus candidus]|uniref:Probable glucan endo-1,3-beta-glucosidase eglC n=1 Tax=Aspergillus candidus TaxID=41067 RepID=A0A2I2FGM4_ASPCN|nr:glycoside hydrolase superfamily [Aspergillus candidus]PLB39759.1 glycoside hydrolase superfamily [Aspergillus candidus]
MHLKSAVALALTLVSAEAVHQGFNYGAAKVDGSSKVESDFAAEFKTAKNLVGTSGFTSARLYTMIQGGTANDPISAIPAAIAEETSLLLGLWASGGGMDNEIAALKKAIDQYGDAFTKLVVGISVGSEDLYRNSVDGVKAHAGIGINPDELVSYIDQVRSTISGTSLSDATIGHVDTWTAWVNGTNSAVIEACDWLGFDGYPYFQNTMPNSIEDAKALFDESVAKTKAAAGGKEVWITETGWPVSGKTENLAVANTENAKIYWDEVGCPLFGNVNTWWYILEDAGSSPSFGVTGADLSTTPLYDLSCKGGSSSSSASASGSSASAVASAGAAGASSGASTGSGSGSGSGSSSGSGSAGVAADSSGQSAGSSEGSSGASSGQFAGSSAGSAGSGSSSGSEQAAGSADQSAGSSTGSGSSSGSAEQAAGSTGADSTGSSAGSSTGSGSSSGSAEQAAGSTGAGSSSGSADQSTGSSAGSTGSASGSDQSTGSSTGASAGSSGSSTGSSAGAVGSSGASSGSSTGAAGSGSSGSGSSAGTSRVSSSAVIPSTQTTAHPGRPNVPVSSGVSRAPTLASARASSIVVSSTKAAVSSHPTSGSESSEGSGSGVGSGKSEGSASSSASVPLATSGATQLTGSVFGIVVLMFAVVVAV